MSLDRMNRRTFLKLLGLGGSGSLPIHFSGCGNASIEEGQEAVSAYVDPTEFVIPGDEVWYASTCRQCPAACGIHARVREGRVRKLEGNPHSPVNRGRLCAMGQAGLQRHYSPDRLLAPLARVNGALEEIAPDEAMRRLRVAISAVKNDGRRFALLTDGVSGHMAVLWRALLERLGSKRHYVYEPLASTTLSAVCRELLQVEAVTFDLAHANLVLSLGADFLGPWRSPVHYTVQYAEMRQPPRGTLIQVEPKMTLTGANADWWLPIRPGTDAWLALGLAQRMAQDAAFAPRLPKRLAAALRPYTPERVSGITDIPVEAIERLARALRTRRPNVVLAGGTAEGQVDGHGALTAALLLNQLLGNLGVTVRAAERLTLSQLGRVPASASAVAALTETLPQTTTLLIHNANPVYSAPRFLGFNDKLKAVPHKIVFATEMDETAREADLVIPVRSYLEDWGTNIAGDSADPGAVALQQPVMVPVNPAVLGIGDYVLGVLRHLDGAYAQWPDFHAYLRHSVALMRLLARTTPDVPPLLTPPVFPPPQPAQALSAPELDRLFWEKVMAGGVLPLPTVRQRLRPRPIVPNLDSPPAADPAYPFYLVPAPRLGLYDGRHANLPWLQELPDQLTTIVWDSWAELHPETAARLGIVEGDIIEIRSPEGSVAVKAVLFPGIHPEVVAVPLGQGHSVGRYAQGIGVNPLEILSPKFDRHTGEFALYATRVQVRPTGRRDRVVKLATSDSQRNRRLVRTRSITELPQEET